MAAGKSQYDDEADSPLFMRLLQMISRFVDGILCPWIALLFPI